MSQLNGMSNSTTFNVSETAPVSVFKSQLHALQDDLPDSDPDLDQEAQRTKLKDNYLNSISWSTYQSIINDLNVMLGEVTSIPPGFFRNYTFDMMHNFTVATVDAEPTWSGQFPTNPSGTTLQDFKTKLGNADVYTYQVNGAVSANVVVQRNLTLVDAHLDKISTVVDRIGDTQVHTPIQSGALWHHYKRVSCYVPLCWTPGVISKPQDKRERVIVRNPRPGQWGAQRP